MRRKDREINDRNEIIKIIEKCEVCRLGLSDNNVPYVVPMNYGYEYKDGKLVLYFHGATEGKKLDIITRNSKACFVIDCSHKLIKDDMPWEYSMEYESVIGNGEITLCTKKSEKIRGLEILMRQYAKDEEFSFPDHVIESVAVFRLDVLELSGKRHLR